MIENHFWDVEIYNIAAPYIYMDLIKRSNPSKFRHFRLGQLCGICWRIIRISLNLKVLLIVVCEVSS